MKLRHYVLTLLAVGALNACNSSQEKQTEDELENYSQEGDSTIYGMACDGCNDTIIVYLRTPYSGTDPDTLNVLEATRHHQVFGKPRIGDKLAIVRSPKDTTAADIVIVTEKMLGNWCYKVLPSLKMRADMEGKTISQKIKQLPDSIADLLKVEHEYGIQLKADNQAFPIGLRKEKNTSDEESPVVYPQQKFYNEWFIYNGQIVLRNMTPDSLGQNHVAFSDTAQLVLLEQDSLILKFNDHQQSFYRQENVK